MRYHAEDPPREKYERIEKSPEDFYPHIKEAVSPPPIPMILEMPELEKAIKEGKKNAKSKSKNSGKESKKVHSRTDKAAVAHV
jgi:hypothetical protein